MMSRERIYIGDFTECNMCDEPFVVGQTIYDAKIIGGRWAWICPKCQKTKTVAGITGMDGSLLCIKYTYKGAPK